MNELSVARWIFLAFFGALLAGVWLLPRGYVLRGAPDRRAWRDLRLWTVALVAAHAVVYWCF